MLLLCVLSELLVTYHSQSQLVHLLFQLWKHRGPQTHVGLCAMLIVNELVDV